MRVIFDHTVPKQLRQFLVGHEVKTAREMAWAGLTNGELLAAAEGGGFDVMVSGDKNLLYQQNLAGRKLALIVLGTNSWKRIMQDTGMVVAALALATPGSFQRVGPEIERTWKNTRTPE